MDLAHGNSGTAEIRQAAAEGVIWGLPLVLFDLVARAHPQTGRFFRLSAEGLALAPGLRATHGDLRCASAVLDLARGPVRLRLPDAHGAYLSLSLHDERGRIVAAFGSRLDVGGNRDILVHGPSWTGGARGGPEICARGRRVWAVCRILGAGEGGREDALRLLETIEAEPWDGPPAVGAGEALQLDPSGSFEAAVAALDPQTALERLDRLLSAEPPADGDPGMLTTLRRIGLGAARAVDFHSMPPAACEALRGGARLGLDRVRRAWMSRAAAPPAGWARADAQDVHDPLEQALAALTGLGAPAPEEVLVFTAGADTEGRPLSGDCDYGLVFEPSAGPPVNAFWSLCVVDPDGAPLEAPFARVSVGDWFGLSPAPGEPFEIRIEPGEAAGAGPRLRPPAGRFGLRLELYGPKREALDRGWRPSGVINHGLRGARALRFAAAPLSVARSPAKSGAGRGVVRFVSKGARP